jgi:hypothetical protein
MTGRPTKFTRRRREVILELLSTGASRRTAAAVAGVDHATLGRWIARGASARAGSTWSEFALDVRQAEAEPKLRALQIAYDNWDGRPELAWKFLEREEFVLPTPKPIEFPPPLDLRFPWDDPEVTRDP